jgi:Fe-S cluster biosynthesis and repair protein YggX
MVTCAKLKRRLPGLDKPPFPGEAGTRIFENISAQAWQMWGRQSVLLINHYSLVLADPEAQQFLREQREAFLFHDDAPPMPEGWEPEGQARGKGAPAPARK